MKEEIKNYSYGLGIIDPETNVNDQVDIVHMAFYPEPPTEKDKQSLWEELRNDDEFGITKIVDRLQMIELPENIVEQVWEDMEQAGKDNA